MNTPNQGNGPVSDVRENIKFFVSTDENNSSGKRITFDGLFMGV